jgi:hypothetical protein
MDHLHPRLRTFVQLPAIDRVARMKSTMWIGYGRANHILATLSDLITSEPLPLNNLLIIGPPKNGKTMILKKFQRHHLTRPRSMSEGRIVPAVPVLAIRMPVSPSVARLQNTLLAALEAPVGLNGRLDQREALVLSLMRAVGVRMLAVDDLDNLLISSGRRQREIVTMVLRLGHQLAIPVIGLGTKNVYAALWSDHQLNASFQLEILPAWIDDSEFARLLMSFESMLPLREPSGLTSTPVRELVIELTKGLIGEIAILLSNAATEALLAGRERIDVASIEAAHPSARRSLTLTKRGGRSESRA